MCKKCLTPWSLGQFTLRIRPSNRKRKARRKFQIERLQKEAKESKTAGGKRKIERLQQQNNHAAVIYSNLFADYLEFISVFLYSFINASAAPNRQQKSSYGSEKVEV